MIDDNWFNGGIMVSKKGNVETYLLASEDGTINTLEGLVAYKKGFYILTGSKGEKYPMSPEKFRELKTDLGSGRCQPKKISKLAKLADHDGEVKTSWGEKLSYRKEEDYIVKHGSGDYGVVKKSIFFDTYEKA